ncbi:hypothetical protein MFLO_11495 [Listeria floridensis FSL S10-1187]|uniref:WxL domain-containing protein n=1 Tax=Listeria floridensis FSL S10-1187 TaxID=1265817 RepID=A0ABN0RDN0_9LIST|nr:WxL domain-containing protein [Listeria floridensis]EUJ29204.1 hypothetical protein MFLO_11495 [Listeria floridensis FSL S10-1187]
MKGREFLLALVFGSILLLGLQIIPQESEAAIALGDSQVTGSFSNGAYNQSVVTITYRYAPLVAVSLNDTPVAIIELPKEIGDALAGSTTKQNAFLASLTGTVTYPSTVLFNQTDNLTTTMAVTKSYDEATHTLLFVFPRSTLLLALTNYWQVNLSFDAGVLYKKGIRIPAAYNGTSYAIRGTFVSVTEGINLTTGNTKSGVLLTSALGIGNYPVLSLAAPKLNDNLVQLGKTVSGSAGQTLDSGYTYTADVTVEKSSGGTITKTNIPVAADGSFQTTLDESYEYGDRATAILHAASKTTTDYYESPKSTAVLVKWPISPPQLDTLVPGSQSVTGSFTAQTAGLYQIHLTVNGQSIIQNVSGTTFSVPVTALAVGNSVTAEIYGVSTRTGAVLVTSSAVQKMVPYAVPVIQLTHRFEKQNSSGTFEAASYAVSGQTIRVTSTSMLMNAYSMWDKETIKSSIPVGLSNISNVKLVKITASGDVKQLAAPQIVTDASSPSGQSLQATLTADPLLQVGDKLEWQYTGTILDSGYPSKITASSLVGGLDGNGNAIQSVSGLLDLAVKNGTLRLESVPTTIDFGTITVPTKPTTYQPVTSNMAIQITDGRVVKKKWSLYLSEVTPLSNGSKILSGSFYYQNGSSVNQLTPDSLLVTSQTVNSDDPYQINLDADHGLRIKVEPRPEIEANKSYSGEVMWSLVDAP